MPTQHNKAPNHGLCRCDGQVQEDEDAARHIRRQLLRGDVPLRLVRRDGHRHGVRPTGTPALEALRAPPRVKRGALRGTRNRLSDVCQVTCASDSGRASRVASYLVTQPVRSHLSSRHVVHGNSDATHDQLATAELARRAVWNRWEVASQTQTLDCHTSAPRHSTQRTRLKRKHGHW